MLHYYRPRSEGYVFTGVCHSFCSTGGGGEGGGQHQRSQHLPPLPPRDQVTTPPPPGTRSQYLPPPQDQVTTPLSLPLLGPGHNTSLPPPPGTRSQHPPSPLGPGHMHACMRYTSYWNAFLFIRFIENPFRGNSIGNELSYKLE